MLLHVCRLAEQLEKEASFGSMIKGIGKRGLNALKKPKATMNAVIEAGGSAIDKGSKIIGGAALAATPIAAIRPGQVSQQLSSSIV